MMTRIVGDKHLMQQTKSINFPFSQIADYGPCEPNGDDECIPHQMSNTPKANKSFFISLSFQNETNNLEESYF